ASPRRCLARTSPRETAERRLVDGQDRASPRARAVPADPERPSSAETPPSGRFFAPLPRKGLFGVAKNTSLPRRFAFLGEIWGVSGSTRAFGRQIRRDLGLGLGLVLVVLGRGLAGPAPRGPHLGRDVGQTGELAARGHKACAG